MKQRICVLVTGDDRDSVHVVEEVAAAAGYRTILATDPQEAAEALTGGLAGQTLADIERRAILDTLRACRGNKAATARALGVCEKTIYNKLKRLNGHARL
jgi:DNA-binding NtrC family response regulator